jgi:hypothetical protein
MTCTVTGFLFSPKAPPVSTYFSVFQGEKSGPSETWIRPSHLTLATAPQRGTTTRAGKPWSGGSGSPFIPRARIVSSSRAFSTGSGRRILTESRLSSITSRAVFFSPARSSISPRGMPVHSATPTAPSRH